MMTLRQRMSGRKTHSVSSVEFGWMKTLDIKRVPVTVCRTGTVLDLHTEE